MTIKLGISFFLLLPLVGLAQNEHYQAITDSIAAQLQRTQQHQYYVSGLEVDSEMKDSINSDVTILDPYRTLAGCFIFLAAGTWSENGDHPPSLVGIYRISSNAIAWRSEPLPISFASGAMSRIAGTGEFNSDGKVEIVVHQGKEPLATIEQLWIFTWDGNSGELITQQDEYGESTILSFGESRFVDVDNDGIYEIEGSWYQGEATDTVTLVTFAWNGSLYGKWGRASKVLLRDRSKR